MELNRWSKLLPLHLDDQTETAEDQTETPKSAETCCRQYRTLILVNSARTTPFLDLSQLRLTAQTYLRHLAVGGLSQSLLPDISLAIAKSSHSLARLSVLRCTRNERAGDDHTLDKAIALCSSLSMLSLDCCYTTALLPFLHSRAWVVLELFALPTPFDPWVEVALENIDTAKLLCKSNGLDFLCLLHLHH